MNHPLPTSQTWAAQELATARFGDARLTQRLIRIVAAKLANPTGSIPQARGDWAATKAAYRFFASDQIRPDAIRAAHRDATFDRVLAPGSFDPASSAEHLERIRRIQRLAELRRGGRQHPGGAY